MQTIVKRGIQMISTRSRNLWVALATLMITLSAAPASAAGGELDTAINDGFGKLVKYGRWTAALALVVMFCLSAAERGQNQDNPHEQQRATKKMIWTGAGFVAVIGYKLILTGIVTWFNIDRTAIPDFLWQ